MKFEFDRDWICPTDPTATSERVDQYCRHYAIKHQIVSRFDPQVIVEIGVRAGYAARTFMAACPDAYYFGFDAENGMHGGAGGPFTGHAKWLLESAGCRYSIAAPLDTQTLATMPVLADFYHIDGDHSPVGVFHDLEICFSSAPVGGAILVDDITYHGAPGVSEGVEAWLKHGRGVGAMEWSKIPSPRGELLIIKTARRGRMDQCRHGVPLEWNCNGCSDSGIDPRHDEIDQENGDNYEAR